MDRDGYVSLLLGLLTGLGGLGIVVATATDRDAYVSAGAAVVRLLSAAAILYSKRTAGS